MNDARAAAFVRRFAQEQRTMAKIKIDDALYDRVKKIATTAGYTTADEFIVHMIEKELSHLEGAQTDEEVTERLRGLGYLE